MKFAVVSQDLLTVTGHAGRATRFLVFEAEAGKEPVETARLDLEDDQSMHSFQGGAHPLDGVGVLIAGSAGQCFIDKMQARGIVTVLANGITAHQAVAAYMAGVLKPATDVEACECHH